MFVRWWRLQEEDLQRLWRMYGWFSGLMCVGSVFGLVAWAAWMQFLLALFSGSTPGLTHAQAQSSLVQQNYWEAVFLIPYALEFMCLSISKLMVLERMVGFVVAKGDGMNDMSRRVSVWGRVVMAVVVVCNVVSLCGSVAAAVLIGESANLYAASGAANSANNTNDSINLGKQASLKEYNGLVAVSVQQFSEVAVLLIVVIAFAVVGIAGARRINSALRIITDENGSVTAAGRQLRRQIVGTTAFVFVTFLLRAVFSTMFALARALQNADAVCAATASSVCDSACFNQWRLMDYWIVFTPEYQAMVILISSPVAMIVALWGMTSKRALELMKSGRQSAAAGHRVSVETNKGKELAAMVDTSVVIRK